MKYVAVISTLLVALLSISVNEARAVEPQSVTLLVTVGSGESLNMGMTGSLATGGGPIAFQGQQIGMMMHGSQSATMQNMMNQTQSLQQRMMTFDFPGMGTMFAVMTGGTPWTGGKGMIMGGTDALAGMSGSISVGPEVGPNTYEFTFTYRMP